MNQDKRSLVLITVDCLRADHCGFYGYPRPTTPFLDALATESFVAPAAIVAGAPTYYSLPGILASRMPLALGRDVIGLAPGESTLATALRESGYATGAFSAGNPYISGRFGYDQGFDVFHDFLDYETQTIPSNIPSQTTSGDSVRGRMNRAIRNLAEAFGLSSVYKELYFQYCMQIAPPAPGMDALRRFPAADVLIDRAQSWLQAIGQRPFFLWLHLMDPHAPYYPPNDAYREMTGTNMDPGRARYLNAYWNRADLPPSGFKAKRNEIVVLYDAGVRWADRQIGRLVETLRQAHLWNDCVLALTADHGEEFLEHGGRYHSLVHLSEEIVRVPLLIRVPGERGVTLPASPISHLHLAPTLLEMIGVQTPCAFQGRSLWSNLQRGIPVDDPAIIECAYGCTNPFRRENRSASRLLGVREDRFKLTMRLDPGRFEEVYDLQADPAETSPISNGPTQEVRKRLLRAAHEHLEKTVSARDPILRLQARLRDLRGEILGA